MCARRAQEGPGKIIRCRAARLAAFIRDFLPDLGSIQYVTNRKIQLVNDFSRCASGRQNTGPYAQLILWDADFSKGWHCGQFGQSRGCCGHGERSLQALPDGGQSSLAGIEHQKGLTRQYCFARGACSIIGKVTDFQLQASLEQFARDMFWTPDSV